MAVYSWRQGAQSPTLTPSLHLYFIMSAKLVFLLAVIALCGLVTVSEAQYYGGYYGSYGLGYGGYGYGGYGGYGYGGYGYGYPGYYGGYSYYGKRSAGFEPKN